MSSDYWYKIYLQVSFDVKMTDAHDLEKVNLNFEMVFIIKVFIRTYKWHCSENGRLYVQMKNISRGFISTYE